MKYNILINQKAITELNAELPTDLQLDLKDASILAWMMDFYAEPKAKKIMKDQVVYFWVSYGLIIKENPLLNITDKQRVAIRIDKLIAIGLVEKYVAINESNRTYFAILQKAFELIRYSETPTEVYSQKSIPILSKEYTLYSQKSNDNTISNNTINKSEALAFDFLKVNDQLMYERLMMEFSKTPNFSKLVDLFNCKFDEEQLKYIPKVIFSRFRRFALNFVSNEQKSNPTEQPYVYLRKIS